jgi:quercetin dioxygenase-like cupin family protein
MGEITFRPFAGDELMAVRVEAPTGAVAPSHSHPHEQMALIVTGRVRFHSGGETFDAGPGEVVHFPSSVEHGAEMLEDSVFYDIFHPVREDFLERIANAAS